MQERPFHNHQLVLKPFLCDDIPTLLSWLKDTSAEFLMQFAGPRYSHPLNEEQILKTMQDKHSLVFKALEANNDEMVGHCQLLKIDPELKRASIGRVLVRPDLQNRGYGKVIMSELIRYAQATIGIVQFELRVFAFNKGACTCYSSLGFSETKKEDVYFDQILKTWTCITMEKNL